MNADAYLDRIGCTDLRAETASPDHETLQRVLSAHIRTVPFENLAIGGHPHDDVDGDGVSLRLPDLYEKIVDRERGGFCFELNGLFTWLLRELGYDTDRCAARVVSDAESLGRPPANHHTTVVHLDQPYLVDAGTGTPKPRDPIPLDGTAVEDAAGVAWRVRPDDMALSDYVLELRPPGETAWSIRYRFQVQPRTLGYFEATCEFLANEPDGTFTSGPFVKRSTPEGWVGLDADTLTRVAGTEETETAVTPDEWATVLAREFGIRL